jgi:hypothetical protein
VGPRAGLDATEKKKIPSSHRESKPRTPIVQPVASSCIIQKKVPISIIVKVKR